MSGLTLSSWTLGGFRPTRTTTAKGWGIESAPDTIEQSTGGTVDVITKGNKEKHGGNAVLYTGRSSYGKPAIKTPSEDISWRIPGSLNGP